MDILHAAMKWIDHNRYFAGILALTLCISIGFVSCQPKTDSILTPGKQITSAELQREAIIVTKDAESKLAQLEVAQADLQRQAELRAKFVEIAGALGTAAAAGSMNPLGVVNAVVSLAALGAAGGLIADNRRKDAIIKDAKA